jgi:FixJ family two-component response regulator
MLNKQVAADLGISEITVKIHRRHIMEKMDVSSLVELARMMERLRSDDSIPTYT